MENKNCKIFIILAIILVFNISNAQKRNNKAVAKNQHSTDSLINEFSNTIYTTIYNPEFRTICYTPTITTLKVEINEYGKVSDIRFSDSADTLFLKAFSRRKKYHDDKLTIERYAQAKSYTKISLLILVDYEPGYDIHRNFEYKKIESLMKFGSKDFSGNAIILAPIRIPILSKHDI